jgi:hypothetical protein
MSLKLKVNLFFAALLLISLIASTGVLLSNAKQSVQSEVENTMNTAARLITITLSGNALSRDNGVNNNINELIKALSEIRSLHILLFDQHGLLFEGEPETDLEESVPDWFVRVLFPKIQPLTKRFGNGHMVIYAAPMQEITERWLDIRDLIFLGLASFLAAMVFLYWAVERLMRPLERLMDALAGFERGNLHIRLPHFSLPEMDRIGQTFNRMGQALELSTEENRRLAVLVKQSGDAILSLDHASNITFCNPAAERLFSQPAELLLGESFLSLGLVRQKQRICQIVENCDTVENLETDIMTKHAVTSALFSSVPLLDAEQNVIGLICTIRDITEHKKIEAAETQLRETRLLAKHMGEVQETERRHLARELHDELGQCLTAIKTDAVLIRNRTQDTDKKLYTSAQAIIDIASHIYDVVHNMITRLRPSPLDDLGLVPTLEESISSWRQRQPEIDFSLSVNGDLADLSESLNMTVFRVVQEAITNAVRHAEAERIYITVANQSEVTGKDELMIIIQDDGKGMEVTDFHSDVDFGLLGMRERAHSLGGEFQLTSSLGEGVTIKVTLPLNMENA